jgi:purine nucleoside permease
MLHQILHIMTLKQCIVLEQNDNAQAVLVVYGEEPASRYPARVHSNIGH